MKTVCDTVYQICKWLIIVLGSFMLGVVFVGIISRYFFKKPLIWEYETCIAIFIWCTFLGAATCFRDRQHIAFGMLTNALPGLPRKVVMLIKNILMLAVLVLGIRYGYHVVEFTMRAKYQTLNLSQAWSYAALPVGFAISLLFYLENLIRNGITADS
ncbi:MAG: TRAP transporter small permease [Planctomycetes bacterium]|nr:TRAP transporter small permease [Planctomycetota bacterium]